MTRKFYLCISLLLAFITAAASDSDNRRFDLMGKADEAIAAGEWNKAEDFLVEAINVTPGDPTNTLIMSNLGIVRFYMGKDSLALATLDDAAALAPASVTVLLNRARVRAGTGNTAGAKEDYRRIVTLDSTVVAPQFYLSIMALAEGDTATAGRYARNVIKLQPDGFEASFAMASLLSARGMSAEAIPYYTNLLNLDKQPDYYAARAICYLQTEDLQAAADDIASGLALDPADGELYLYRAILNKMRFRPDDAKSDAKRAVELGIDKARVDAAMR